VSERNASKFERQVAARDAYARRTPGWMDSVALFRRTLSELVPAGARVLDLGCGRLGLHGNDTACAAGSTVIGVDTDHAALMDNNVLAARVAGAGEALPFADSVFDVVASAWVLEHLEYPGLVFAEVQRVLRPGGRFVFLTPNAWNYNVWLIRAIPNRLHEAMTRSLYGRMPGDTYPVRYRANTEKVLRRLLLAAGFDKAHFTFNGDPSYIAFNRALFELGSVLERVMDARRLRRGRVHILGVAQRSG
jgi:SAM-dependent methyltransferase